MIFLPPLLEGYVKVNSASVDTNRVMVGGYDYSIDLEFLGNMGEIEFETQFSGALIEPSVLGGSLLASVWLLREPVNSTSISTATSLIASSSIQSNSSKKPNKRRRSTKILIFVQMNPKLKVITFSTRNDPLWAWGIFRNQDPQRIPREL